MNKLSLALALLATLISALVIFGTRAFSFIVFSRKKIPDFISALEKKLPPAILALLIVYCFKDISFETFPFGIPAFLGSALAIVLHLVFKNPFVSIFASTILYVILIRLL